MFAVGRSMFWRSHKPLQNLVVRRRRRAVGSDAILYGDAASLIFAEGRLNDSVLLTKVAMHDREIFFEDVSALPDLPQFQRCLIGLRNHGDAAGLAIEPVHQM